MNGGNCPVTKQADTDSMSSRSNITAGGFTIFESLLMIALMIVLMVTSFALYRKGPPAAGWLSSSPVPIPKAQPKMIDLENTPP
jgi:hypothetical protein